MVKERCDICLEPGYMHGLLRDCYSTTTIRHLCEKHLNMADKELERIRDKQAPALKAYLRDLRTKAWKERILKRNRTERINAIRGVLSKYKTWFIAVPPYLAIAGIVTYKLLF